MSWVYLLLAIAAEVAGTLELRAAATGASHRALAFAIVTVAYLISFGFMMLALRTIGVGPVYAIWSGVGTFAIAILGWWLFGERISWLGALGMALIVGGVIVLVLSGSDQHASAKPPPVGSSAPAEPI